MNKSISEEILGFIQGYVMATRWSRISSRTWRDDVRGLLSPHLDDDAIFTEAVKEAGRRLDARHNYNLAKADELERIANALMGPN